MAVFDYDTGAKPKSAALSQLIQEKTGAAPARILVVGCGRGDDAQALAAYFGCAVDAIDSERDSIAGADRRVTFHRMDACALDFDDRTFDLVYSFHALEHIADWRTALMEMRRVLRDDGIYCVDTPNRTRAVGHLGVPGVSLTDKLRYNLMDWGQRLRGRFYNEYGAHAGFTRSDLEAKCAIIGPGTDIADEYYAAIYEKRRRLMQFIVAARLQYVAWPSVYVLGRKVRRRNPDCVNVIPTRGS